MKKILAVLVLVLFVTGCEAVASGNYKPGNYLGSKEYTSYGKTYVVTALVNVDDDGKIDNVFVDTTYQTSAGVITTKKVLGDAYGMAKTEDDLEWYEQLKLIEEKVVAEQGIDWLVYSDDAKTKTDTVAGVTITVDAYQAAISNALEQAKK